MSTTELSRPVPLDSIGREPQRLTVEASEAECTALAVRMGLPAVHALSCTFELRRESGAAAGAAGVIAAHGRLSARVVQSCVVTLDEFEADVADEFDLRFVPAGSESEEIELEGPDEIPYSGTRIDLGDAAAEQLALALDPFPRKPGVAVAAADAGGPATPFAGLAKLRRH